LRRRKRNSHPQNREEFSNENKQRYNWMKKIFPPSIRNQIQSPLERHILCDIDPKLTEGHFK